MRLGLPTTPLRSLRTADAIYLLAPPSSWIQPGWLFASIEVSVSFGEAQGRRAIGRLASAFIPDKRDLNPLPHHTCVRWAH